MSALLVLPEDRIAREIERWQQINADEERCYRAWPSLSSAWPPLRRDLRHWRSACMGKPRDDWRLGADRILGRAALEQRRSVRIWLRVLDAGERHLELSWCTGCRARAGGARPLRLRALHSYLRS